MVNLFTSLAEFERYLIRERTHAGLQGLGRIVPARIELLYSFGFR